MNRAISRRLVELADVVTEIYNSLEVFKAYASCAFYVKHMQDKALDALDIITAIEERD